MNPHTLNYVDLYRSPKPCTSVIVARLVGAALGLVALYFTTVFLLSL